jgi:hypothetical protein
MRSSRLLPLLLGATSAAALALAASPDDAEAFCRTSSCPGVGTSKVCSPPEGNDCGLPVFWPKDCVSFSLQEDASAEVPYDVAEAVFEEAFAKWTGAACPGGGTPHIKVVKTAPIECSTHEYNQSAELGNANVMIFRDAKWPHAGAGSTLALTTVTYNVKDGEIYDADMEVNSAEIALTTGDTDVQFDLPSIITHEAGHFLGLSHSREEGATMAAEYKPGTIDLRDLSDDDIAGICAIYPPGDPIPDACDSRPRHGFSARCAADIRADLADSCSVTDAGAQEGSRESGRGPRAAFAMGLGALALALRVGARRRLYRLFAGLRARA